MVPFRIPAARSSSLAARQWAMGQSTGVPPATAGSNSSAASFSFARASSSAPFSAMSCLFGVTTLRPLSSAALT